MFVWIFLIELNHKLRIHSPLKLKPIEFKKNTFDYYNIFDGFILASTCSEGTPITILEAMASEVPVFTTMVGAIPSFAISGENSIGLTLNIDEDCSSIVKNIKNKNIIKKAKSYVKKNHDGRNIANFFTKVVLSENLYNRVDSRVLYFV